MTRMTMTIKDVAARSGLSAPTLRYYEQIGLLPDVTRTAAGYRTYDETTLDRLAFITRTKQLGCSLDEIARLTAAWAGGRCGPVQDHLRVLVADKLEATHEQIAELTELTHDLRRASRALDAHRPDGPCDDRCGCLADRDDTAPDRPVAGSAEGTPHGAPVPVACSLGARELGDRLAEWDAVLRATERRRALVDGVRVELGTDTPITELARLVAAEQSCCRFLRFAITVDHRGVGLEVTGAADARTVIDSVFGVAS